MTVSNTEGEHIAALVHCDEYPKHIGQVASVYTDRLILVKRKLVSMTSFELAQLPMHDCSSITYEIKWAVFSMVFGALLAISIVLALFFGSVPGGARVPFGALACVFILGVILVRGPKRHRLTFVIDGKKFRWDSKAGDFKYKTVSTQKIVAFAKERGLLQS